MRNFIVLGLLVCSSVVFAQENSLTAEQFNGIRMNGVAFKALSDTHGDASKFNSLFNQSSAKVTEGEEGMGAGWRTFDYTNGFTVSFTDVNSSKETPSIYYIKGNSITVKNKTVSIGDSIEFLGNVVYNKKQDGTEPVMYITGNGDCCPMVIEFDNDTRKITKIEYFV